MLPTWATLAAESSRRRKEKKQSDLRIGEGCSLFPSAFSFGDRLSDGEFNRNLANIEMKSATTCIALAVILSCFFSTQTTSQPRQSDIHSADRTATGSEGQPPVAWTSLVAWPITSPQPVLATDGKMHLVYELLVMNVSSSAMTLDRLETLDASKDDAGTSTKSADTIVATLQGADLEATIRAFPTGSTRTVGPFQLTRIFLDVKFAKDATVPRALTHRFQVTLRLPPAHLRLIRQRL